MITLKVTGLMSLAASAATAIATTEIGYGAALFGFCVFAESVLHRTLE